MGMIEIITLVVTPVVRSVAGWLENAFEDGEISAFEWKQLFSTVLRVGMIGFAAYFGLNGMGVEINALGAGASAVIIDFIFSALKAKKKK